MENALSGRERSRRSRAPSTDTPSAMAGMRLWRTATQASSIGIFVILSIAVLDLARPILLPVTSAFVVSMMLGPLSSRAERARIPVVLTAIVLWLLVLIVCYGVVVLLAMPAVDWVGKGPDISRALQDKLHVLDGPLTALQELRNALLPADKKGEGVGFDIIGVVQTAISFVTPAISQLLVFFGALFFMLLGRSAFRRVVVGLFDMREVRLRALRILNDIERNLTGYLSMVAIINVVVGIVAGSIAWVAGLPNPLAWAVLGFILNFIPYIGPLLMEVALLVVGLAAFPTLAHAFVAPLLYLAFTTFEGHFITPGLVGRRLTMNPLTVFLTLVFWTWLWGPVGAFLAVPLLIIGLVAISHVFPSDEPELPG